MASGKDIVAGQLATGQYLIEKFTADLSDEEFFTATVAGAKHAGWVSSHLARGGEAVGAGGRG